MPALQLTDSNLPSCSMALEFFPIAATGTAFQGISAAKSICIAQVHSTAAIRSRETRTRPPCTKG